MHTIILTILLSLAILHFGRYLVSLITALAIAGLIGGFAIAIALKNNPMPTTPVAKAAAYAREHNYKQHCPKGDIFNQYDPVCPQYYATSE